MGRMEYWDPVTQSRKPAKAGSIVDNTGLEYSPSDVKAINDKTNTLEGELVSHKADYEYQVSVIVGRQIRLVKKSNTSILKFKLDTDIVEGTQLTISTNGGSASKPLVDFEGEPILELEKGFVEVVEGSVNFTLRPSGVELKYSDDFIAKSVNYGGTINTLASDNDYIYCAGNTTNRVWKIRKSDMTKVAESPNYGGSIMVIALQSGYIYCAGVGSVVWKLRAYDMAKVAESGSHSGTITSLCTNASNIYSGTNVIRKLNLATMSIESTSVNYGGAIRALALAGGYLICGGDNVRKAWSVSANHLGKIAESPDYGGTIRAITVLDSAIFIGGDSSKVWYIGAANNMGKSNESIALEPIQSLTSSGSLLTNSGFIYCGTNSGIFHKLQNTLLTKVAESPNYGGAITSLDTDDNFVYCGGQTTQVVSKALALMVGHYKYKNLALISTEVLR